VTEVPRFIRVIDPLARRLLKLGVPLGPNALLTVRGRRSGQPRTAGVAVVEIDERRWVIGSYGNVNWVRNLRAAREATIHKGRRAQHVTARELSTDEAEAFFRDILTPYVDELPWIGRVWVDEEITSDPDVAALSRPVFELQIGRN
jgi:deazaflavin-dependent oxidoreductase (nitroreductase family)